MGRGIPTLEAEATLGAERAKQERRSAQAAGAEDWGDPLPCAIGAEPLSEGSASMLACFARVDMRVGVAGGKGPQWWVRKPRAEAAGGHLLPETCDFQNGNQNTEQTMVLEELLSDHSYEEIRGAALDLLAGRESGSYGISQYESLLTGVAEVFSRRGMLQPQENRFMGSSNASLSRADKEIFLEVFWGLFREGVITLGMDDSNREFPWFRVSAFGQRILDGQDTYFFHDVSTYEKLIQKEVPTLDAVTLLYLKEAMQAFRVGSILAATVMLGVATEHTFLLMLEAATANATWGSRVTKANNERMILPKITRFKAALDGNLADLTPTVREDLDTHFLGIISIIRNFRNQSGHPSGLIVSREQCYVLLQLFVPYAKKMYQLRGLFV